MRERSRGSKGTASKSSVCVVEIKSLESTGRVDARVMPSRVVGEQERQTDRQESEKRASGEPEAVTPTP